MKKGSLYRQLRLGEKRMGEAGQEGERGREKETDRFPGDFI